MTMDFFGWLSATAVSFTVAGNTGVSPFLSLLLVGVLEKANPDLLNMGGSIEAILSSWPSLIVLVALTVLELVGKCIPVVDEIIDSAMAFILPIMSTLGSLSTFGLFHVSNNNSSSSEDDGSHRDLGVASGALIGFQIVVVLIGIVLAFSVHALKMTIRFLGTGWLTNCLTVLETLWIVTTITVAVFIRPIAIFIAVCICSGAVFSIKRNLIDKRRGHDVGVADNQASLADNAHQHHHTPDEDDDYVKIEDPCDMVVVGFDGVSRKK